MPRYSEQVIRTYVTTDLGGLPSRWEIELELPPDDPWSSGFRAWARRGTFVPKWIGVSRRDASPGSHRPPTIVIQVRSRIGGNAPPIELSLPWPYATALARMIVKAARSLDHAAMDAIAELLDGKEWNGADDLGAIAALVRHSGREVRDLPDAAETTVPDSDQTDSQQLTVTASDDRVTIIRDGIPILGIDLQSHTVGHWPDGETWEVLAVLPAELSLEEGEGPDDAEETVLCRFCQRHCRARTAHDYHGGWVGDECCWDERLRSSE
jgi:hypothetical protein